MANDGDAYWRTRAGAPAQKGVLATSRGLQPRQPARPDAPVRMARYEPAASVAGLVRHYWLPRWSLAPGAVVSQAVLEYPSANLVIEPTDAGLYGPERGRGVQRLEGTGWAFGALLQPGIARALIDGDLARIVGSSAPLSSLRVAGTASLAAHVREAMRADADALAVAAFDEWLHSLALELGSDAHRVREVVDRAENDRSIVRVEQLAAVTGQSMRSLQRLVRDQLGLSPKWLIQRYRMQEAAFALSADAPLSLADLAASLGFADQAHFTRDFRAVIGETPAVYAARAAEAGAAEAGAAEAPAEARAEAGRDADAGVQEISR
ncbi:helix-turn-helix domain-containing protein [Rathayibacter sp. YIM 133350]|uniref:AraC family transcriptional regulator n=1 Tax=Rathayibacter sp. YIM 133350 TaxID=3131992 RepID=UPI00307F1C37